MLQFGRAVLLQNHQPAAEERSISYCLYTGFHVKPALGEFLNIDGMKKKNLTFLYKLYIIGSSHNPIPRRRFIKQLDLFQTSVQTVSHMIIRSCESKG